MYLCHECRKRFVEDIGKPSYSSWYDISIGRIFIEDTLEGKTLDKSAEKFITWEGYDEYNHLNKMNSLHSRMEERHKRCHGVADKYLPRYCALWAKVHSLSGQDLADKVKSVLGLYFRREDDTRLKTSNLKTSNISLMAAS